MPEVETLVYTNDPSRVLPILERELDDFTTEATKFLDGQTPEDTFIKFRLKQGVYGQRQSGVQMMRVKLPFGGVTPEQMETFADIAENYAPLRKGPHHHAPELPVPSRAAAARCRSALRAGQGGPFVSREACGNTVRNVTGDPFAGVAADELFDPTPYAGAFARYWLRNPLSQALPRKFKVAFSSSQADHPITGLHDLAFIPRIKDGQQGFKVVTGGGLAIMPRTAYVLREFCTFDEYLKISEAVMRIFDKADELRKNRAKARLKFLVDRVGIEEFRRMVDEELEGDWTNKDFRPDRLLYFDDEAATAPQRRPHYLPAKRRWTRVHVFRLLERARPKTTGLQHDRGEAHARRPQA